MIEKNALEPKQWLTLSLFSFTILEVITNIVDNTLSALVGVVLMGQAKGEYAFPSHLKWIPAIVLGYGASILVPMWINARTF